ncbi:uncharacterized protein LOC100907539 [Galendromus occidentalis]|uniref:Uncharacterized protein LOC100907539 n=1 Tax=Galendromus occidentalis TaxID=34638 RepID=A0AAJ7P8W7_9ACAR|nr:uncharacterized protein LOC100907539 [Galendromus occidentalis]
MSTMVEPRVSPLLPTPSPARRLPAIPVDHQIFVEWEPQSKRFALALHARRKHIAHLTATEIHKAHGELRQVYPAIDEVFPTKLAPRTCSEATSVCANLKRYLKGVLDGCGATLLAWVFFMAEEVSHAEFDPEVDKFQRKILEVDLAKSRDELTRLLDSKAGLGLDTAYSMEDEIVTNISLALGELFNFRISTFAEMRDLCEKQRSSHWTDRAEQAQQAVDELTIIYHAACLDLVLGQRDRMKRDHGAGVDFARWTASHQARFLKLSVFVSQERLRWMMAVRTFKRREYDRLSQGNSPKKQDRSLTELKKDIYEHLLKILQEEEILLKKQKMILEKISSGEADAEEFGDAVEDVEELEMIYGKRKCLTLIEATVRLSSIYQRRAILRNKVQACQNILNKGGLRDSSVSFTGRLSGDSSGCVSLTTPSEEAMEFSRRRTVAFLQEHFRGLQPNNIPIARLNGKTNTNISDTRINVKAMSLS